MKITAFICALLLSIPTLAGAIGITATKPPASHMLEIARGNVPGVSGLVLRGHNPTQAAASGFVDVAEQGDLTYLTSAETMEIASTSTDDDGDPLGDGIRTVLISGVDGSGDLATEVVILNGTTDVTTANSYLRVNSMVGVTVGDTGWNVGDITATASVAATIQCEVDATESISQGSHYTVPNGFRLCVLQLEFNVAKATGGTAPIVEFKAYARIGGAGAPWVQFFDKKLDAADNNELDVVLPIPFCGLTAGTDFRVTADTDQNSTESRVRFYGTLEEVP